VKMMTALVVLQDHPLGATSEGPTITITASDVVAYQLDLLTQQSVVKVAAGETLTERQALEAMLIPSANNIAAILASWDAGTESAFVAKMNAEAAKLGMTHTHYASASGLNPNSVSTAADQLKLVETAMSEPAFANIVAEPQVTLPVAGLQYNINALVTHNGIIGVKTGFTPQAGGCFAFAAQRSSGGHSFTVVGVVLGQQVGLSLLTTALDAGNALADAVGKAVSAVAVVPPGTTVATIHYQWGPTLPVVTSDPLTLLGWPGLRVRSHLAIKYPSKGWTTHHEIIGRLRLSKGKQAVSSPLEVRDASPTPSITWRLLRP
jgi:D-alanyl-D-alanine carboxypeptidase (penicillin-binding protein 5/6)